MLNEYEVPDYISTKLPEIEGDLKDLYLPKDIYHSIQVLTDYTKKVVTADDFKKAAKCLLLGEKIYQKGNMEVKAVLKNVFVLSFTCLKFACTEAEWRIMLSIIPSTLYGLYLRQVRMQEINQ
jgi:hypothetical protein